MFTRSTPNVSSRHRAIPSLPVWPLPALHGRHPVVIPQDHPEVTGVNLAYAREGAGDLIVTYPLHGENGTAEHFMPDRVPVFAVRDGSITYAAKDGHTHSMVIDHGNGWSTYYANLEHMFARPTSKRARRRLDYVRAGDVLGFVGAPVPGVFKQLRFELWTLDEDDELSPVDPRGELTRWRVLPWHQDARITTTESDDPQVAA